MDVRKVKIAATKAAVVLIPSYLAAYLTDKMVYVVPTLAAAGFFASTLEFDAYTKRRVDDDDDADESDYETLDVDVGEHDGVDDG